MKTVNQGEAGPTVRELFESRAQQLNLELLAGANGLDKQITSPRIQKLGLALAGYCDYLHPGRIQFVGQSELDYLNMLDDESRRAAVKKALSHSLCCVLITKGLEAPDELLGYAREFGVPVLRTDSLSSRAIDKVGDYLDRFLAPATSIHGVLLEVSGLGVLIVGDSGVGKSECALELILRAHRLVSDDLVLIRRQGSDRLVGRGPDHLEFHMELRGLGIINIRDLFGISAVKRSQAIDLAVELVRWSQDEEYDRVGLEENRYPLLGVDVPLCRMPVASGRNVATLVEVAVRLQMLRLQGYHPAEGFVRQLDDTLRRNAGNTDG